MLPQGFKNSPMIFGNQLAKELELWKRRYSDGILLQYVDDILLAANARKKCLQMTISLLNFFLDKEGTACQKVKFKLERKL